jgi:hypothetical protein
MRRATHTLNALRVTTLTLVLVAACPVSGSYVYREFLDQRPSWSYTVPGRQPSMLEAATRAAGAASRETQRAVDFDAHYAEAPVSASLDFGCSPRGRDTALLTPHASPFDAPTSQRGPPSLS